MQSKPTVAHRPKAPIGKPMILLFVNLVITFMLIPSMLIFFVFGDDGDHSLLIFHPSSITALLTLTCATFYGAWGMYFVYLSKTHKPKALVPFRWIFQLMKFGLNGKRSFQFFQAMMITSLSCLFSLLLILRSYSHACSIHGPILPVDLGCNPYAEIHIFPMDTAFLSMVIPILIVVILKEKRIPLTLFSWFVTVFGLVYSAILLQSTEAVPIILTYLVMSSLVMIDSFLLQSLAVQLLHQLQSTLEEKQRLENLRKDAEMKDVIANVAHDLKTPLASFMTGVDAIFEDLTQLQAIIDHDPLGAAEPLVKEDEEEAVKGGDENSLRTPSKPRKPRTRRQSMIFEMRQDDLHLIQDSLESLQNIKTTNAFMLMTINRCIDFTKASHGLKLVPKLESVHLEETILLPLSCMRNIQHRIEIELLPFSVAGEEEGAEDKQQQQQPLPEIISPYIITDKQWLQENVLCLLSNAVKYSSAGRVTVKVTLLRNTISNHALLPVSETEKTSGHHLPDEFWKRERESTIDTILLQKEEEEKGIMPVTRISKKGLLSRDTAAGAVPPAAPTTSLQSLQVMMRKAGAMFQSRYASIATTTNASSTAAAAIFPSIADSSAVSSSLSCSFSSASTSAMVVPSSSILPTPFPSERSEGSLLFEICDQGIGMSEEAMQTLFSPFKQTQRLAGGTGLGLYSLSKRIEALKGRYGVKRRSDGLQGSVFWFTIPYQPDLMMGEWLLQEFDQQQQYPSVTSLKSNKQKNSRRLSVAATAASASSKKEVEGLTADPPRSYQVLLVEDTPSIAKMTMMMLKKMGHEVTLAENGEIALNLITQRSSSEVAPAFDVILMDLQMPVMDGLEATKRLRQWERDRGGGGGGVSTAGSSSSSQYVIGVTAAIDAETFEEGKRLGMDDFLPKPFTAVQFNTMMMMKQRYLTTQSTTAITTTTIDQLLH